MLHVKKDSILIGVSELRMGVDKILNKIKNTPAIIEKRNKQIAVLMSKKEYDKRESLLEEMEDIVLGSIAHKRYKNSAADDYIDIGDLLKEYK